MSTYHPVRPRVSDQLLLEVSPRITPRDRSLCHVLWDHQVLTTEQISELAFDNLITCQHRLVRLYRLRVLERFRHFRPTGSDPFHYVLDDLGVRLVAADRGIDPSKTDRRRARSLALADSQRLGHLLGVNGFFCSLAGAARRHRECELEEWWSEQRCIKEWGEVVRPDGFGVWRQGPRRTEFLLEHDRGTETLARLTSKLTGYQDLAEATRWSPWLLFWFLTSGREAEARKVLGSASLPVATACSALGKPSEAVWAPVGNSGHRITIGKLETMVDRRPSHV